VREGRDPIGPDRQAGGSERPPEANERLDGVRDRLSDRRASILAEVARIESGYGRLPRRSSAAGVADHRAGRDLQAVGAPAVKADVAIVGAGITGLSIAFHLAERQGGRIVVYDKGGVGAGASGVQPGGVRQQWGTRVNCLLARRSLAFYRELAERLEARVDPGFRACGYLFLADTQETFARLRSDLELQAELGIPSRPVEPRDAAVIVPGLRAEATLGGAFCGEDGYFDKPQAVVEAFAEAAQRLGVTIETAEVSALGPSAGGWKLRFVDGSSVDAGAVVVAAAADSTEILRPLGVDLPIGAEERYLFYSRPVRERLLDPLVVAPDRRFAAKQLSDGRVLASDLSAAGDAETEGDRWRARVGRNIVELLPRLELVAFPLLVGGVYDVTPDRQAIVGRVPGHEGLLLAAGFSGHGFMIAPEVGRAVAALVLDEDPGGEMAQLRPDRFERGALVQERRVV
jgi:sarcosine oxidase, subunit beta